MAEKKVIELPDVRGTILDNSWLKDRKTLEKAILDLVFEWQPKVGLVEYSVYVTFEREVPMATCAVAQNYYSCQLNFYPRRVLEEAQTNLELEELVVHEMCHVTAWDLAVFAEGGIDEDDERLLEEHELKEERLVTKMARGLLMAKYNLEEIPDSIISRMYHKDFVWEAVRRVTDGGDHAGRGVKKAD